MGSMIEFPSNGSTDIGYLSVPEGGEGPGVVVIQEWWGLVDHIKTSAIASRSKVLWRWHPISITARRLRSRTRRPRR